MQIRCYLLSVKEFNLEGGERLFDAAIKKIDAGRRAKLERLRSRAVRNECLGAGLILQFALRQAINKEAGESFAEYDPVTLTETLPEPLELEMTYGKKGKPYLRDYPFFYNISHSGEYVLCAVSDSEVGADIQRDVWDGSARTEKIADRFFSSEERKALSALRGQEAERDLFFRLWSRKEAYGKLLGEGILSAAAVSLLPGAEETGGRVSFLEWRKPPGYHVCVCGFRTENRE